MKQLLRSRQFWLDVLFSAVLPWLVYQWLQPLRGEVSALWWSATPPAAWALVELLIVRRVDALAILSLAGIGVSLLVDGLGGDARMILVRESVITGAIGLLGLASLCLPRPALFYLARMGVARGNVAHAAAFEANWSVARFRSAMYAMTAVWSAGLVLEAVLRTVLAWRLPVAQFLVVSPLIQYGTLGGLFAWTWYHGRRLRASAIATAGAN